MAKIRSTTNIQVYVTLEVTEDELHALGALAGYGTDKFLKAFYEKMGKSYLEPHAKGLRSLFEEALTHSERIKKAAEAARETYGRMTGSR